MMNTDLLTARDRGIAQLTSSLARFISRFWSRVVGPVGHGKLHGP